MIPMKVMENKPIAKNIYQLTFYSPEIAQKATPGQFVHIKTHDTTDPLLRRPFSISGVDKEGNCHIIYKVVGKGTGLLAQKTFGDNIDVLGPLGTGFCTFPKSIAIIGGGVGIAPLLFLAQTTAKNPGTKKAFLGFTTKTEVFALEKLKSLGFEVFAFTDDGSFGQKGYPTDGLQDYIKSVDILYACGPKPLLKEVKTIAKHTQIPAYLSLEERMACGIGACLGCAVKTKDGYKKACHDGPVFKAEDIEI